MPENGSLGGGIQAPVLIYDRISSNKRQTWLMMFLFVAILGGFVVPGSHRDSLFMLEGVLLDVDNGYVYTGIQTEGVGKIVRPTFVIEDKDAIALAKSKAMAQFGDELLSRMRGLAAKTEPRSIE